MVGRLRRRGNTSLALESVVLCRDPYLKMCLRLIETTVNLLLKIGLRKLLTELVAEKGVRGIARGRQKVLLLIVLDHGKECL